MYGTHIHNGKTSNLESFFTVLTSAVPSAWNGPSTSLPKSQLTQFLSPFNIVLSCELLTETLLVPQTRTGSVLHFHSPSVLPFK